MAHTSSSGQYSRAKVFADKRDCSWRKLTRKAEREAEQKAMFTWPEAERRRVGNCAPHEFSNKFPLISSTENDINLPSSLQALGMFNAQLEWLELELLTNPGARRWHCIKCQSAARWRRYGAILCCCCDFHTAIRCRANASDCPRFVQKACSIGCQTVTLWSSWSW